MTDGVNNAYANEILVINGDVHVVGTEIIDSHYIAKYWKNGVSQFLEEASDANLHSLTIDGSNTYLVGSTNEFNSSTTAIPTFWKNGIAHKLTNGGEVLNGRAVGISVVGTDVFIAGTTMVGTKGIAMYWKNETPTFLTGTDIADAHAYDIKVVNNDIYIAGDSWDNSYFPNPVATYWKNGQPFTVTPASTYASRAFSIDVDGNDVYIAGTEYEEFYDGAGNKRVVPIGKYWKNRNAVALTINNYSEIYSVFVFNGDAYTSGNSDAKEYAHYWKNREPNRLGVKSSTAKSIFVISK